MLAMDRALSLNMLCSGRHLLQGTRSLTLALANNPLMDVVGKFESNQARSNREVKGGGRLVRVVSRRGECEQIRRRDTSLGPPRE
jgi:hypothetical protein